MRHPPLHGGPFPGRSPRASKRVSPHVQHGVLAVAAALSVWGCGAPSQQSRPSHSADAALDSAEAQDSDSSLAAVDRDDAGQDASSGPKDSGAEQPRGDGGSDGSRETGDAAAELREDAGSGDCSADRPLHLYTIGNSLTVDAMPWRVVQAAEAQGIDVVLGWHMRCSSSLEQIVDDPDTACEEPSETFGRWNDALGAHRWDAVTVQPYPAAGSTMQSDIEAILTIIARTRAHADNDHTRFYLWTAWPGHAEYDTVWNEQADYGLSSPTTASLDYMQTLLAELRARTDAELHLLPVGEVLQGLGSRAAAGQLPGIDGLADLYRDDEHLTGDVGRYAASATLTAAVLQRDPAGTAPWGDELTAGQYEVIHAEVWKVLQPLMGLGCWWP